MKNLIKLVFALLFVSCNAQQTISMSIDYSNYLNNNNYIKDTNNDLDKFVGTWKFYDGNKTLIFSLQKLTNHYNGLYYEDTIIGAYKYENNSSLLVDTFPLLQNNYLNTIKYGLSGNSILSNSFHPICQNCFTGEVRLVLLMTDPITNRTAKIYTRKKMLNGQEVLDIKLECSGGLQIEGNPIIPSDCVVPTGEYILIKQ